MSAISNIGRGISAYSATFLISADNKTIYATGSNLFGELGVGDRNPHSSFVTFKLSNVKSIICGDHHTVFLRNDGTAYACGSNLHGQLGVGYVSEAVASPTKINLDNIQEVYISSIYTILVTSDENIYVTGFTDGEPHLATKEILNSICTTDNSALYYVYSNNAYAVGDNTYGQIGNGNNEEQTVPFKIRLNNVEKIYTGKGFAFFQDTNGSVYATGRNTYGQLALGNTNDCSTPALVSLSNIKEIACGKNHVLFLTKDGTLYGCGSNAKGQLGSSNIQSVSSPTRITTGVAKVIAGEDHSIIITNNGNIFVFGANGEGQLGVGNYNDTSTITQLTQFKYMTSDSYITTYEYEGIVYTILVAIEVDANDDKILNVETYVDGVSADSDRKVMTTTEYNNRAQTLSALVNAKVAKAQQVIEIFAKFNVGHYVAAGNNTFLVSADNKTVYVTGENIFGELGTGDREVYTSFTQIQFPDVAKIVPGDHHTIFLTANGEIYGCGNNTFGQLGTGQIAEAVTTPTKLNIKNVEDVDIIGVKTIAYTKNGKMYVTGDAEDPENNCSFKEVTRTDYDKLVNSHDTIHFVKNFKLYSYGMNTWGQLGSGDVIDHVAPVVSEAEDIKAVASGFGFVLTLRLDGYVWGVGKNDKGQLGIGTRTDKELEPVRINLIDVEKVFCGRYHSILLRDNGEAWGFGSNTHGQLGLGSIDYQTKPVKIMTGIKNVVCGDEHTIFIKEDGSIYVTGYNDIGQLGLDDQEDRYVPEMISKNRFINEYSYYELYSYFAANYGIYIDVKDEGGYFRCTPYVNGVQVRDESRVDYTMGDKLELLQEHIEELLADIKDGIANSSSVTIVNQIAAWNSTYAKSIDSNSVYVTGTNIFGQLGLGDLNTRREFTLLEVPGVRKVVAGEHHTLFLTKDGEVYGCGNNSFGQLGIDPIEKVDTPVRLPISGVEDIACMGSQSIMYMKDKTVKIVGSTNANTASKQFVDITDNVEAIAGTYGAIFVLKEDKYAYAMGNNRYGQLGLGDTNSRDEFTKITTIQNVKNIVCGVENTFLITEDGSAYAMGNNSDGQLGVDSIDPYATLPRNLNIPNVRKIAAGYRHTIILTMNGDVYAAGSNSDGQLGMSASVTNSKAPVKIAEGCMDVFCGEFYTFIVKYDGTIYGVGDNGLGQLGIGTSDDTYTFTYVEGIEFLNKNSMIEYYEHCGFEHTIFIQVKEANNSSNINTFVDGKTLDLEEVDHTGHDNIDDYIQEIVQTKYQMAVDYIHLHTIYHKDPVYNYFTHIKFSDGYVIEREGVLSDAEIKAIVDQYLYEKYGIIGYFYDEDFDNYVLGDPDWAPTKGAAINVVKERILSQLNEK